VSIVIPAYNEAASIAHVVRDFRPHAHEVVVMDNCSADGTGDLARAAARSSTRGSSAAIGDASAGDGRGVRRHLVLVEADGHVPREGRRKLLEFLKDADMVIGTRTTAQLIEQGANMDGILAGGTSSSASSSRRSGGRSSRASPTSGARTAPSGATRI
jgi:glycosyltransferase involved in cell wall biosynthesis